MLYKGQNNADQIVLFNMEEFVPQNHLLRKINEVIDFSQIYNISGDLYCSDDGMPSIDPVVLFKMVIIQHLYEIHSLRQTVDEISMNIAYRWFTGYSINDKIPDFAAISYNFKHRFTEEAIEKVFNWILDEINDHGYLSPEAVFMDGTHIKANATIKRRIKENITKAAKIYTEQLMEEINADSEKP